MIKHLVLDIETDSKNPNKANMKVFGAKDVENDKYYIWSWKDNISSDCKKLIEQYDWIITFNGILYDIPILERHNVNFPFWKNLDMYNIIRKRPLLFNKDGFESFKLKYIVEALGLYEKGKGDIDYTIFFKLPEEWSDDDIQSIIKYLKQDLNSTQKLFEFAIKKFEPFAEFIEEKDARRYKHITTTAGSYAYKVICKMTGLEESYSDAPDNDEKFKGAFVSVPSVESATGTVVVLDFKSLYPFMIIQGNLYSHDCKCCKREEKWHGNVNLPGIKGYYCSKVQGIIEEKLKILFLKRQEFKRNKDVREAAMKIVINSLYGITGNPRFLQLYDLNTAEDCTYSGQQAIKYARKRLNEMGYNVLYSDTDSAYVQVPSNRSLFDLQLLATDIAKNIASWFPFPWYEEFEFKVDDILQYIHFFPNDKGDFLKKNYLYITNENKLVIKGLQIKKLTCSKLSRKIFDEDLHDKIIENLNCKFDKKYITELIENYLRHDLSLGLKRFNAKSEYNEDTSLWSQISKVYGEGEHELIKNKRIGVGKKVKYCTLDEAKNLQYSDLDINVYLDELSPFIKNYVVKNGGLNDFI